MALKDEWQARRQQRQQEVAQRQQQVHETLASAQQERQYKASQLRDDLSLFRESLMQNEKVRSLKVQRFQAELQQFRLQLQAETQAFLAATSDRRQAQAQVLAHQLDQFVQALQQQTAQFLALAEADRIAMAQQLTQDLRSFHEALTATVVSLRQQIQTDINELKTNTQCFLIANQQQRIQTHIKLAKELSAFTEALRQDVQTYLWEMETLRQVRADELHQMLTQSRTNRLADVQRLFSNLADFRAELRQFHTNLESSVWGENSAPSQALPQKSQPKAQPKLAKPLATKLEAPSVAVIPLSPAVTNGSTAPLPSTNGTGIAGKGFAVAVAPTKNGKAAQKDGMTYEKDVYNYIHQAQGARLTEIESALKITRFQAVDALRSLIKKGLVTQRDRIYLVQEDFAHN